jgi:hypothetical protein
MRFSTSALTASCCFFISTVSTVAFDVTAPVCSLMWSCALLASALIDDNRYFRSATSAEALCAAAATRLHSSA